MPKTKSLEILHQNTNKDSNTSLHDILTNLSGGKLGSMLVKKSDDDFDIGWNEEILVEFGDALAKFEYLLEMYANDQEALVREVKTITAKFGTSQAQIMEELLVQASKSKSLASKITRLNAELNGNVSTIEETLTTVVTDTGALAQAILDLEVSFNDQIASVTTYAEAIAGDLEGLTTVVDGVQGDVTTIAGQVTTLDSEVNTVQSDVATVQARWGVQVDAGGRVAGVQLNSSSTGSSNFIVLADNFKVYRSGYTSDPIFATGTVNGVATVGIKGNLVVDGSIITAGVANNAITQTGSANGTYSAFASFTIDIAAPVYILGVFTQGSGRSGQPVGLYLDGVQQTSEQPIEGTVGAMARIANVAAGTHTVSIGAFSNIGDMRCNIMYLVMKK